MEAGLASCESGGRALAVSVTENLIDGTLDDVVGVILSFKDVPVAWRN